MFKKTLLVALLCLLPFEVYSSQLQLTPTMKQVGCGPYKDVDNELRTKWLEEPETIGFAGVSAQDPNVERSNFNIIVYKYKNKFTFSFVEHFSSGTACVISAGISLEFSKHDYDLFMRENSKI